MEIDIQTSPEIDKLLAAISKAQAEMKPAPKNALNPAFARGSSKGSKYADLADCVEAIRPHITKHGLCLLQPYGGPSVVTLLGHESGQWIKSRIPIPRFEELNPQQIGSATTYLRRYSLGIVGLVTDEDDDGNAASGHSPPRGVTTVDPRGDNRTPSDPEVVDKWAKKVADAMAAEDQAAAVYAIHTELAPDDHLYIDVADAVAERGICGKGKWKELVRAGNPNQRRGKAA